MSFIDRHDAGQQLAQRLLRYAKEDPLVLALPRGGVPVGFEIAKALRAPLDLVLVRKIGAPFQPELAVGAVVDGEQPVIVLNPEVIEPLGISKAFIEEETERVLKEIEERRQTYLAGRPRPDVGGRTAIVVDDGIATGATITAALRATRRARPSRLVLAVPVAPLDRVEDLRREADAVHCLETPMDFRAIGLFYMNFHQLSDREVVILLDEAGKFQARRPASSENA